MNTSMNTNITYCLFRLKFWATVIYDYEQLYIITYMHTIRLNKLQYSWCMYIIASFTYSTFPDQICFKWNVIIKSRHYRNFYSGYNRKFHVTHTEIIGMRRTIAHGTHEGPMVPTSCQKQLFLKLGLWWRTKFE